MIKIDKRVNSKMPFIQVPKVLFENERYRCLSVAAILLYALLLDRYKIAVRNCNAWRNNQGQVYICYTIAEAERHIRCGHDKACGLFRELQNVGLIERKRKGLGMESQIVVFLPAANSEEQELLKSEYQHLQSADYQVFRSDRAVDNNTNKSLLIDNTYETDQDLPGNECQFGIGENERHVSTKWDIATAYDTFFATYPVDKRGNYSQGLAAYRAVVTTPAEASKALEILATWIRNPNWKKNNGQYIPALTNYLKRGYIYRAVPQVKSELYGSGELGEAELEAIKKLMRG